LILAGPILRRVESDSVSVWVALSESPTKVRLSVYVGRVSDITPSVLFSTSGLTPVGDGKAEQDDILRIGEKLYVTVVTAPIPQKLSSGQEYSYLLSFEGLTDPTIANNGTADLKSLGLLGPNNDIYRPNLPLGYALGSLPSFAAPPTNPEDLIILHGSCRKMHGADRDAMSFADAIVGNLPPFRPHQLFLTGDQIYADEVPSVISWELSHIARELFGIEEAIGVSDTGGNLVPGSPFGVNRFTFPPGSRQTLIRKYARLSSTAAASHLLSFGEFCAMYLMTWSNVLWPDQLAAKNVVFDPNPPLPPTKSLLDKVGTSASDFDADTNAVFEYRTHLPEIRRLLANVPVLMILDDHEITDDWYLSGGWKTNALYPGNVLGRAIIRNGLAAYAVFQAWGNNPNDFVAGTAGRDLLDNIKRLFPQSGQDANAAGELEGRFGFNGTDATIEWSYTVERSHYRFVVLDTRTRRSYASPGSPPTLLGTAAFDDQIPTSLTKLPLTIIISPVPVAGLPLFEEVLQPAYAGWYDSLYYLLHYTQFSFLRYLFDVDPPPGQIQADVESWGLDHKAFEELLTRLYDLENVVVLSGDVHYGFSTSLTYWRAGSPRRIAQLTSSALKNPLPPSLFDSFWTSVARKVFGGTQREIAKLGWNQSISVTMPGGDAPFPSEVSDPPVVVSVNSLRPGTLIVPKQWDWSWRVRVEEDQHQSRPSSTQQQGIPVDQFLPAAVLPVYAALTAWSAEEVLRAARVVAWPSNIGHVRFNKLNQQLSVDHTLLFVNPSLIVNGIPEPNIVHTIPIGMVIDPDEPKVP